MEQIEQWFIIKKLYRTQNRKKTNKIIQNFVNKEMNI